MNLIELFICFPGSLNVFLYLNNRKQVLLQPPSPKTVSTCFYNFSKTEILSLCLPHLKHSLLTSNQMILNIVHFEVENMEIMKYETQT